MIDCYDFINSPSFFYVEGDCEAVNHDIKIDKGDLANDDLIVMSAILIQLSSDRKLGTERGFWGDQFTGFPLGTHIWSLTGKPSGDDITVKADEMIRVALEPFIDQGLIDEVKVRAVRTIDGVEAEIDLLKNNVSVFKAVI